MGTKWDLDIWQGEKGKRSPTVKVSCTAQLMVEIQRPEGWLKTVIHISHSVFETWNLNRPYLQTLTSHKPVTTQVMAFLQCAQPQAQLTGYLNQNSTEALQIVQHSAEHIKLQGWFSMGPLYVQHPASEVLSVLLPCIPAYTCSHIHSARQDHIWSYTFHIWGKNCSWDALHSEGSQEYRRPCIGSISQAVSFQVPLGENLMTLAKPDPRQDMRNMLNLLAKEKK